LSLNKVIAEKRGPSQISHVPLPCFFASVRNKWTSNSYHL
jgi:hypothetical protein